MLLRVLRLRALIGVKPLIGFGSTGAYTGATCGAGADGD